MRPETLHFSRRPGGAQAQVAGLSLSSRIWATTQPGLSPRRQPARAVRSVVLVLYQWLFSFCHLRVPWDHPASRGETAAKACGYVRPHHLSHMAAWGLGAQPEPPALHGVGLSLSWGSLC